MNEQDPDRSSGRAMMSGYIRWIHRTDTASRPKGGSPSTSGAARAGPVASVQAPGTLAQHRNDTISANSRIRACAQPDS